MNPDDLTQENSLAVETHAVIQIHLGRGYSQQLPLRVGGPAQ